MSDPILGMRFAVVFLAGGAVPNPLDIRFQKVSGLSVEIETQALAEGGNNTGALSLPMGVKHGNLLLERGMVVGSLLNLEFNATLSLFKFATSNVLVTLLGGNKVPLAAWLFIKAYPVKWATSDLSAGEPALARNDPLEAEYAVESDRPGCRVITLARAGRRFWPNPLS